MKSSRIVIVNILVLLILLGGGAVAVYYYNQSINYISTDNAKVDGQAITIASTSPGLLQSWRGKVGDTYTAGQDLGTVLTDKGNVSIKMPHSATIVLQNAAVNTVVGAGMSLAKAFDLGDLYVTANVKETQINDVKVNQTVDVYVDSFPGTALTGKVDQIGLATAGTFSLLPTSNTTGNYTKVTQVIPIKISLDGYRGLGLVPGMSVSIRIHK
ncbi:efflux RND transporter periplasmic adaptor subunit [Paenibacillus terrigena]|uniref:efflux RND transporter periplasmic adaptor subunit n=1 Tax=Paenibacillus terrigena TaxID=369333 RepID=UPI0003603EAB|nr:efflux RND transporter periplasmic adaptor subunit [Paenibacillus terrigena]